MAKKPNAADITHALAKLGGGAKKDGGGGMMAGMENILKKGIEYGMQQELPNNQSPKEIEHPKSPLLYPGKDEE